MDTILINFENSKTSDPHRLLLNLSDEINSKRSDKNVLFYQISAYTIHEKIYKKLYKNNKFKTSTPTWNDNF